MIYIILILFFTSLISIVFMIGKKLILLKNEQTVVQDGVSFEIPYLKETRGLILKNIKKYEHLSLVVVVRFYIQFSNSVKYKYEEIKNKMQKRKNTVNNIASERAEVSKFLKMISDYKHKIREIKHKIKEEEKEL